MNKTLKLLDSSLDTEIKMNSVKYSSFLQILGFLVAMQLAYYPNTGIEKFLYISLPVVVYFGLGKLFLKIAHKRSQKLINSATRGTLQLQDGNILINFKGKEILISEGFNQTLNFYYFGYFGETEGYFGYDEVFYGTTNYLTVGVNSEEKVFIYLDDNENRSVYYQIINTALHMGVAVNEYYRGQKSYGGKRLNYKEIQEYKKRFERP